jgi:hypothetical protein
MKDVMWRRGHSEDQPGGLELRQSGRTNFVPMFDRHGDIKEEILNVLNAGRLRVSVFLKIGRLDLLTCNASLLIEKLF